MLYHVLIAIPGEEKKELPFSYEKRALDFFNEMKRNSSGKGKGKGKVVLYQVDQGEKWEMDSFTINYIS